MDSLVGSKSKILSAVYHLPAKRVVISDLIDLLSCVFRQFRYHFKGFLAAKSQISPRDIQTGQQQIGAAGRLCQIDDLTDISRMRSFFRSAGRNSASDFRRTCAYSLRQYLRPPPSPKQEDYFRNKNVSRAPHPQGLSYLFHAPFSQLLLNQNRPRSRSDC